MVNIAYPDYSPHVPKILTPVGPYSCLFWPFSGSFLGILLTCSDCLVELLKTIIKLACLFMQFGIAYSFTTCLSTYQISPRDPLSILGKKCFFAFPLVLHPSELDATRLHIFFACAFLSKFANLCKLSFAHQIRKRLFPRIQL